MTVGTFEGTFGDRSVLPGGGRGPCLPPRCWRDRGDVPTLEIVTVTGSIRGGTQRGQLWLW